MLTGRPGRFGSTPSLLVGIGGYTAENSDTQTLQQSQTGKQTNNMEKNHILLTTSLIIHFTHFCDITSGLVG